VLVLSIVQGHCYLSMEMMMRSRAWDGTHQSIKTRLNLECEKEHQEHLLLSVMPAYIAAEVSASRKMYLGHFVFLKSKETNKLRKVKYMHFVTFHIFTKLYKRVIGSN
jgi:hypothetical protein